MKRLKFAVYYDITAIAKERNNDYNQYERVLICVDTWDIWFVRIQKGWRDDEEGYVQDPDNYLLERNKVEKPSRTYMIDKMNQIHELIDEDDFSNWDCHNYDSLEEALDDLADIFGIKEIEND